MTMPETIPITDLPTNDLRGWLAQTATKHNCIYLLAYAEDGVIWGRVDGGGLITSYDVFGAPHCRAMLRATTLWEARLFGPTAEVLLWRADGGWKVRIIHDVGLQANDDYIAESQMLWGDHVAKPEHRAKGFTLLSDGREGLCHAVPINVPDTSFVDQTDTNGKRRLRPVRLHVRHYIDFDGFGNARIALSRLVNLA